MFCNNSEAAALARILIQGYPNASASDAQGYAAQLVTVFTGFDVELVKKGVSPSGIPLEHPEFMPSVGAVTAWLTKKQEHFSMISRRIAPPEEQVGDWINYIPTPRLRQMGEDWLNRRDPVAQQISGAKAKRDYTAEEKREFLDDAYRIGAEISGMKLAGTK